MFCPVCNTNISNYHYEIRSKIYCKQCHSLIESCCEGSGPSITDFDRIREEYGEKKVMFPHIPSYGRFEV